MTPDLEKRISETLVNAFADNNLTFNDKGQLTEKQNKPMKKTHLGDSVYAEFDESDETLILTTNNGFGTKDRIILDPEVVKTLLDYIKEISE